MRRRPVLLLGLLALVAACGDGGLATTTTALPTTSAPTTTRAPVTTTTTPTTTLPPDVHPVWGASWEEVWPEDGETAVYRVRILHGQPEELPARFETGVVWRGAASDRIIIGTVAPNQMGIALYLDGPEPWVLSLRGAEATAGADASEEYFAEPLLLDLWGLPAMPPEGEVDLFLHHAGDVLRGPFPIRHRLEWVGIEALDVAAGRFPEALHCRILSSGEYLNSDGTPWVSNVWLDPRAFILKLEMPLLSLELVTPWE